MYQEEDQVKEQVLIHQNSLLVKVDQDHKVKINQVNQDQRVRINPKHKVKINQVNQDQRVRINQEHKVKINQVVQKKIILYLKNILIIIIS